VYFYVLINLSVQYTQKSIYFIFYIKIETFLVLFINLLFSLLKNVLREIIINYLLRINYYYYNYNSTLF